MPCDRSDGQRAISSGLSRPAKRVSFGVARFNHSRLELFFSIAMHSATGAGVYANISCATKSIVMLISCVGTSVGNWATVECIWKEAYIRVGSDLHDSGEVF